MTKQIPFIHKLFLGALTGLFLGVLAFFIVNSIVTVTNAIAVKAGAIAPGPYDPPWAYGLLGLIMGFSVPVIGVISMDMNQRAAVASAEDNGEAKSST